MTAYLREPLRLYIVPFFYEEKGKHKERHFKVSDKQGSNATFRLSDGKLLAGSMKKPSDCKKVKYWLLECNGRKKIEDVLVKQT